MDALIKILKVLESKPDNSIFYGPNISTWAQVGVAETKGVLAKLAKEGVLVQVKVPKYRGEVMSEFAVAPSEEFDWENMQDPDDFTQLTKHDIDEALGFKKSSGWKVRAKLAKMIATEPEHAWFKFKEDRFDSCARCGIVRRKDDKNKACPGLVKISFR